MPSNISGINQSNIYLNTITGGEAVEIQSNNNSTQSTINLSMKQNTEEQSSPNNNDWILVADNSTGKIVKRILYSNFVDGSSNWTLNSGFLYPNSTSTKVIIGRTGTSNFNLDVEGSVNIDGDLQLDNNRNITGVKEIHFNDSGNNNIIKLLSNVDIGSNIDIYLPSIGGTLALTSQLPTGTNWTLNSGFLYPNSTSTKVIIGRTGTSNFNLDVEGSVNIDGDLQLDNNRQISGIRQLLINDVSNNNYYTVVGAELNSDVSITLPSSAGTLALLSDFTTQSNFGTNASCTFGTSFFTQTLTGQDVSIDGDEINLKFNGSTRARLLSNRFETQTTLRTSNSVHFTNLNSNAGSTAVEFHSGSIPVLSPFSWRNQIGSAGDLHYDFKTSSSSSWTPQGYVFYGRGFYKLMNFTGQHRCIPQVEDLYDNVENYIGMVVEATGEYNSIDYINTQTREQTVFSNPNPSIDEAQPIIKLTTTSKSKKVYGVISSKEVSNDGKRIFSVGIFSSIVSDLTDNRLVINSIGEGGVLVCNQNGNIENGDLLCSSDITGIAMKQDTDFIMNYTIGKATQDYTFIDSNERKLIGCVYYCA